MGFHHGEQFLQAAFKCLVIALIAFLAGFAVAEEPDLFQRAKQARAEGRLEAAVDYLLQAYAESNDPTLLNNIGKVYEEMGQYDRAYQMYKKVLDDPNASPDLKALDEERLSRLQPKLSQTQVVVPMSMGSRKVWINGAAYPLGSGIEYAVPAGRFDVEMLDAGSGVMVRLRLEGPPGRRMVLKHDVTQNIDQGLGGVGWSKTTKIKQLFIDEQPVSGALDQVGLIQLAPGTYVLQIHWVGLPKETRTVTIEQGRRFELAPLPAKNSKTATALNKANSATALTPGSQTAPPIDGLLSHRRPSRAVELAQVGLTLTGLAISISGYFIYANADQARQTDVDQAQDQRQIDALLMPDEGSAYEDWQSKNRELTQDMNQGIWMMSGGGLIAASGLVWWLSEGALSGDVSTASFGVDGHQWFVRGQF